MKSERGGKLPIFTQGARIMNATSRRWFGILTLSLVIVWAAGVRAEDKKTTGNATGTWKSSFTTPKGQVFETTYVLKQEGEKLTGTAKGARGGEAKIEEGKVKDGKVSFQVSREFNDRKFTMKYEGKLNGDTIKGKMEFKVGDETRSVDWEAKRQKKAEDKKSK